MSVSPPTVAGIHDRGLIGARSDPGNKGAKFTEVDGSDNVLALWHDNGTDWVNDSPPTAPSAPSGPAGGDLGAAFPDPSVEQVLGTAIPGGVDAILALAGDDPGVNPPSALNPFLTVMGAAAISEGADGSSAYEIALIEGFVGTVDDWLASLVGAAGADGADSVVPGPEGPEGPAGTGLDLTGYVEGDTLRVTGTDGPAAPFALDAALATKAELPITKADVTDLVSDLSNVFGLANTAYTTADAAAIATAAEETRALAAEALLETIIAHNADLAAMLPLDIGAVRWRGVSPTDLATDLQEGDLFRNTTEYIFKLRTGSGWLRVGPAINHAVSHEPGGEAAMAVDAAAATGSLRTLGTGATQAAAGNDSRLSDPRTPTAHAASHNDGGADEVTLATSQVTGLDAALAAAGGSVPHGNTFPGSPATGDHYIKDDYAAGPTEFYWNGADWLSTQILEVSAGIGPFTNAGTIYALPEGVLYGADIWGIDLTFAYQVNTTHNASNYYNLTGAPFAGTYATNKSSVASWVANAPVALGVKYTAPTTFFASTAKVGTPGTTNWLVSMRYRLVG